MKDQKRNLNPHKPAVCAMWLLGKAYSTQGGGAMDFWDSLSPSAQDMFRRMADEITKARAEEELETK